MRVMGEHLHNHQKRTVTSNPRKGTPYYERCEVFAAANASAIKTDSRPISERREPFPCHFLAYKHSLFFFNTLLVVRK